MLQEYLKDSLKDGSLAEIPLVIRASNPAGILKGHLRDGSLAEIA